MSSLTAVERETVVTLNDEDDTAHIYTHQSIWITKLKKNPEALLLDEGVDGTTKWAQFEVPSWAISVRKARRTSSDAQRQAAKDNVAKARAVRVR